jgi:hypothetical protein
LSRFGTPRNLSDSFDYQATQCELSELLTTSFLARRENCTADRRKSTPLDSGERNEERFLMNACGFAGMGFFWLVASEHDLLDPGGPA